MYYIRNDTILLHLQWSPVFKAGSCNFFHKKGLLEGLGFKRQVGFKLRLENGKLLKCHVKILALCAICICVLLCAFSKMCILLAK